MRSWWAPGLTTALAVASCDREPPAAGAPKPGGVEVDLTARITGWAPPSRPEFEAPAPPCDPAPALAALEGLYPREAALDLAAVRAALHRQRGCPLDRFAFAPAPRRPDDRALGAALRLAKGVLVDPGGGPSGDPQVWLDVASFGADLARGAGLLGALASAGVLRAWTTAARTGAPPAFWGGGEVLAGQLRAVVAEAVRHTPDILATEALGTALGVWLATHPDPKLAQWQYLDAQGQALAASLDPKATEVALGAYLAGADRRVGELHAAVAGGIDALQEVVRRWRHTPPVPGDVSSLLFDIGPHSRHLLAYLTALEGVLEVAEGVARGVPPR